MATYYFPQAFAPNLRTDYCLDPTAIVVGGFFVFFASLILFVNFAEYPNFSLNKDRVLDKNWVSFDGFWKLVALCGLLATQIAAWTRYQVLLDYHNFAGLIYGRDVFALPLSIISFVFVAVNGVILPSGMWMNLERKRADLTEKQQEANIMQKQQMRKAMFYFNYIFWVAFYVVTGAQTYRQFMFLKANTDNAGTYPTNLETLCALTMAFSLAMVVYIYVHFQSVFGENVLEQETEKVQRAFDTNDIDDSKDPLSDVVRATRYHGFIGIQTVSQKMLVPFYYMTCFYTALVFLLNYNDYFQFAMASSFVIGCTILGTFMSKSMGTFHFYFAYALWFLTTVTYVVTDIMNDSVNTDLNGNSWMNPTNNIAGMQLNVSTVVKPVNYPATQNLLTGIVGAMSGILFMRSLPSTTFRT